MIAKNGPSCRVKPLSSMYKAGVAKDRVNNALQGEDGKSDGTEDTRDSSLHGTGSAGRAAAARSG